MCVAVWHILVVSVTVSSGSSASSAAELSVTSLAFISIPLLGRDIDIRAATELYCHRNHVCCVCCLVGPTAVVGVGLGAFA